MGVWRRPPRVAAALPWITWAVAAVVVTLAMDVGRSPRAPAELMMKETTPPPKPVPAEPKSRSLTYEPWEKVPS
jgi:hypothetical protein